ncbi:MAG TPA: NfeD family protein [Blastocatellia bacterium]|nr:NfeD family protein [Blastocatellia bacterium]
MSDYWYIWMILGVLFIVAEIFTPGFVLLWFGVGAIIAGLLSMTGLVGLPLQVIIFLSISVALTIASRTIFERVFMRGSPGKGLKSGIESLPGRVAVVVSASEGALAEGAIRVYGSTWRAFPIEGEEPLKEGEQVRIERVEGTSVYVSRVGQLPSWRQADRIAE